MAYPPTIATLHFQYKTAFDALKMFTDNNDDQLALMVLDFKSKKELSKPKVAKVADKVADDVTADKVADDVADKVADDKVADKVADDKVELSKPAKVAKVAEPKSKSKVSKLK
jgi:aspartate carbamoyltransferase regulatory subunit